MTESKTRITVSQNHREREGKYRSVEIQGDLECAKKAAKLVIAHIELMLAKKQSVDFRRKPLIDKNMETKAKIVLHDDAEKTVIGEKGLFATALSRQFDVKLLLEKN